MPRAKAKESSKGNSANVGFEAKLWLAADKLRSNMDAAEYKHVVLGLIFLKYITDSFEEKHAELTKEKGADPEDPDEYRADNIFWVPPAARWTYLQNSAKQPTIGKSEKSRLKDFASTGSKKAKDVAKFVYKNRKEIIEVITLLGSLLALGRGAGRRKR